MAEESTHRRQAEEEPDGFFCMSVNRLGIIGFNDCCKGVRECRHSESRLRKEFFACALTEIFLC